MSRILLTKEPNTLDLPRDGRTLWLHHPKERIEAERTLDLPTFMEKGWDAIAGVDLLVVVGLVSRLCTPSNRVRIGQFLTDPWDGPPRISVDDKLFITDPWRLWWHFGCVAAPWGECYTSYKLETQWNSSLVGMRENPCTPQEVERWGKGVISAINPFRFTEVDVHVEPMSKDVQEDYAEEKERAFNEETTHTAIIKRLASFADRVYPFRAVPSFRQLFDSESAVLRLTDLGVDRWLKQQLQLRIDLTNYVAEHF